jgi:hypothetical protein
LGSRVGPKGGKGEWREKEKVLHFLKGINQLNSSLNLNSSNHKQCSSMNAIHTTFFNLENQTKNFFYTIFPVKKIKAGQNFKI